MATHTIPIYPHPSLCGMATIRSPIDGFMSGMLEKAEMERVKRMAKLDM
jgi:hypothetical protein